MPRTLYFSSTELSTKVWRLSNSAPSTINIATIATVAKIAADNYMALAPGTTTTGSSTSFIVGDTDGAHGWRSESLYKGVFTSGNFTIDYKVRQQTKYAHSGRVVANVYRSSNANPSVEQLTLMNSAVGQSDIISLGTTAEVTFTGSLTVNCNQNLTLDNEYIIIVLNWLITTAGANSTCAVALAVNEGTAEKVTTSAYSQQATGLSTYDAVADIEASGSTIIAHEISLNTIGDLEVIHAKSIDEIVELELVSDIDVTNGVKNIVGEVIVESISDITSEAIAQINSTWFEYREKGTIGWTETSPIYLVNMTVPGTFSDVVSGLDSSKVYEYRTVLSYDNEQFVSTSYGDIEEFQLLIEITGYVEFEAVSDLDTAGAKGSTSIIELNCESSVSTQGFQIAHHSITLYATGEYLAEGFKSVAGSVEVIADCDTESNVSKGAIGYAVLEAICDFEISYEVFIFITAGEIVYQGLTVIEGSGSKQARSPPAELEQIASIDNTGIKSADSECIIDLEGSVEVTGIKNVSGNAELETISNIELTGNKSVSDILTLEVISSLESIGIKSAQNNIELVNISDITVQGDVYQEYHADGESTLSVISDIEVTGIKAVTGLSELENIASIEVLGQTVTAHEVSLITISDIDISGSKSSSGLVEVEVISELDIVGYKSAIGLCEFEDNSEIDISGLKIALGAVEINTISSIEMVGIKSIKAPILVATQVEDYIHLEWEVV